MHIFCLFQKSFICPCRNTIKSTLFSRASPRNICPKRFFSLVFILPSFRQRGVYKVTNLSIFIHVVQNIGSHSVDTLKNAKKSWMNYLCTRVAARLHYLSLKFERSILEKTLILSFCGKQLADDLYLVLFKNFIPL